MHDEYIRKARVLKVVDGDTIDLNIDLGFDISLRQRVRLAGIDAPESRTRDKDEKRAGLAASAHLMKLCPVDSIVTLRSDEYNRGKYGRVLGTIFVGDTNINETMIKEGHAVPYE